MSSHRGEKIIGWGLEQHYARWKRGEKKKENRSRKPAALLLMNRPLICSLNNGPHWYRAAEKHLIKYRVSAESRESYHRRWETRVLAVVPLWSPGYYRTGGGWDGGGRVTSSSIGS